MKISWLFTGLQNIATKQLIVSKQQLKVQEHLAASKVFKQERECLQIFRLTSGTRDITYEWYKHRVEDRVENTCMWFLRHQHFRSWLKADSGPLFVSADPGCGKSVLAKYLIHHVLPETTRQTDVCYFFFPKHRISTQSVKHFALWFTGYSPRSRVWYRQQCHYTKGMLRLWSTQQYLYGPFSRMLSKIPAQDLSLLYLMRLTSVLSRQAW